jgi:hypothetical protein
MPGNAMMVWCLENTATSQKSVQFIACPCARFAESGELAMSASSIFG